MGDPENLRFKPSRHSQQSLLPRFTRVRHGFAALRSRVGNDLNADLFPKRIGNVKTQSKRRKVMEMPRIYAKTGQNQ
jgi:hypothetical protein